MSQSAIAGSGFYYGFDAISHSLDTSTGVRLTFSPPPPSPSFESDNKSRSPTDIGFHAGYLFRHRRTQKYFISPEFFVNKLDRDDTTYGTNFKLGTDFTSTRIYMNFGVSRINTFKQNKLHFGLGAEYAVSDHQAIGIEWLHIDSIVENTTSNSTFGTQVLTTETNTKRDINSIKVTFRIYLLE